MTYNLFNQSNLEFLKSQPDNSIDSIVTDPPYGISFMGKSWDYDVPNVETWKELMRVLKPGGHIIVACGTRTQHRMAVNIEDAGFEIRDIVAWVYGSGFPKSLNIGKAVDKLQGNERELLDYVKRADGSNPRINVTAKSSHFGTGDSNDQRPTKGNSPYEGWGTALKPAMELWTLARKPLSEKTVAENVLKWGTGGINIDECRVEGKLEGDPNRFSKTDSGSFNKFSYSPPVVRTEGRFPANFIHDGSDEVVSMFPRSKSSDAIRKGNQSKNTGAENGANCYGKYNDIDTKGYSDDGSNARFFYTAKASKSERNAGLNGFEEKNVSHDGRDAFIENPYQRHENVQKNHHPTVKPVALMRYLARLITPKGGVVLDPYMGSGSTGVACMQEGFNFIGVEMDKEYFEIAKARIEHWTIQ